MPVAGQKELDRAKELRSMKKGRSAEAQRGLEEAAARLEASAIKKLNRVGRRRPKKAVKVL